MAAAKRIFPRLLHNIPPPARPAASRAERRALRERQALPRPLEKRLVLAEQPLQRHVQVFEPHRLAPRRAHIVPYLVREALDVVREVAGELDDRGAPSWWPKPTTRDGELPIEAA